MSCSANKRRLARRVHASASSWRSVVALLACAAIASVCVGTTSALFSDASDQSQIRVSAGSVEAPTAFTVIDTGTTTRAAWTAPGSGIPPQSYDVFRRPSSGSYGGTPIASPTSSPWNDATASECTTWVYKARSRHTNLTSSFTPEQSITVDRTAPATGEAHLVWTEVTPHVVDFVRVNPGGSVEVFADVTDNCASRDELTVSFTFGAPFNSTVPTEYSTAGWTPVAGGPTYHHRFVYVLPAYSMADGAQLTWNVVATDPSGNTSTTPGTTVTADGTPPVFQRAQMVSAFTNHYDVAYGVGEIPSDGTARASGSYVYADFSDASGIAEITANLAVPGYVIKNGTTSLPLTEGTYATYGGGSSWTWRSAATTINPGMADGTRRFTVTATDRVGNVATTSGNRNVEIDDTRPSATGASCAAVAGTGSNNRLAAGDAAEWDFGDTIWWGSIRPDWTGDLLTQDVTLRNGTRDHVDLNADLGLSLLAGGTYTNLWNLNNASWVGADSLFAGSTLAATDRSTLRFTFGGTPNLTARTGTMTTRVGTSIRDAAGNISTGAYTLSCSMNPW